MLRFLFLNAKSVHFQIPASDTTPLFIHQVAVKSLHQSSNNDQFLYFVTGFFEDKFYNLIFFNRF